MEEKRILNNGLKINYKITGEGPVVLVLHGWRSSSKTWEIVQKFLADVGYKVYLLDLPGFGKSDNPSKPWQVSDYTHFILNTVGQLGLESFFLLGHSFGGRIAVQLSACYSHRVKKLILCGAPAIKPKPSSKQKIISFLVKIAKFIFPSQKARNIFYSLLGPKDLKKVQGVMRETFKKVVSEDLEFYLGQIKSETLIVWGEKDEMVPLSVAHLIKKKISNSKLVIIPEAGHSVQIEKPKKLVKIIADFLN